MLRQESRGLGSLTLLAVALGCCALACQSDVGPEPSVGASASVENAERVLIGDIHWYVDYDAATKIAREQDKALWVHFGENPG